MRWCVACETEFDGPGWTCPACGHAPTIHESHVSFVDASAFHGDMFEGRFFETLAKLEEGFWWFEARNDLIVWALRHWFPSAKSLLEIGCGTGFVVSRIAHDFPAVATSASDLFPDAMTFVKSRAPNTLLYQIDGRCIPFRAEFDVIGAFDVIEHIEDDRAVMRQVYKAVRPGGGLLVTVPQHPFLWTSYDEYGHHKRRYTRRSLARLLLDAGFEIVALRSFVSLLFPALLLSRLRDKGAKSVDPLGEFRVSSRVNATLRGVMRGEFALLQRGANFPCGGSLLAVARRAA